MTTMLSPESWIPLLRQVSEHSIHVMGHSDRLSPTVHKAARDLGMTFFRIDLAEVESMDGFLDALAQEMLFPYPARDMNVAADLVSDLAWLGNDNGYVFLLTRADTFLRRHRRDFRILVVHLTDVCDSWQKQAVPFHLIVSGSKRMRSKVTAIVSRNEKRWVAARRRNPFLNRPLRLESDPSVTVPAHCPVSVRDYGELISRNGIDG